MGGCSAQAAINDQRGNRNINPSASNELLGKSDYRRELVKQQSARCLAAYLYAGSGPGESTTDVVFSGHSIVSENGIILAETERFQFSTQVFSQILMCSA